MTRQVALALATRSTYFIGRQLRPPKANLARTDQHETFLSHMQRGTVACLICKVSTRHDSTEFRAQDACDGTRKSPCKLSVEQHLRCIRTAAAGCGQSRRLCCCSPVLPKDTDFPCTLLLSASSLSGGHGVLN